MDDVGDCETLRLECCRPRLSLSIPPRADCARPGRGGRALWCPSALDPSRLRLFPTLPARAPSMDESDCTDPERRLWWNDPTLNLRLK